MRQVRGFIIALISAACSVAGPTAATPCGFEDPTGATFAQGSLAFLYPNALYVGTAVWMAQQDGILARDERPAGLKALLGYQQAVGKLGRFRERLSIALNGHQLPAFSIAYLGPMLWIRFELTDGKLLMTPHTEGPANGDLVIVTDEPVIAALIEGRITPQKARELGLMRLYGPPEAVQDLTSIFDRLSPETGTSSVNVSN